MTTYGVYQWSNTASANSSADVNVYIAEGIAPSAVNDQFRAIMQSFAKWRDDNNGTLVALGSTTAAAITSNQGFSALVSGLTVEFGLPGTLNTSATLNVDGLGAQQLYVNNTTLITSGQLQGGSINRATYLSSLPGWMIKEVVVPNTVGLMTLSGTDQVVSGGAKTPAFACTSSTQLTIDPGDGALQYVKNSSAMVIRMSTAADGYCTLSVLNTSAMGTLTTSGFTVNGFTGDSASSTSSGKTYFYNLMRINGVSTYTVKATQ